MLYLTVSYVWWLIRVGWTILGAYKLLLRMSDVFGEVCMNKPVMVVGDLLSCIEFVG